jgi:hypothetical protein
MIDTHALEIVDQHFDESTHLSVSIPLSKVDEVLSQLRELKIVASYLGRSR